MDFKNRADSLETDLLGHWDKGYLGGCCASKIREFSFLAGEI
jgi:hypothetical protein